MITTVYAFLACIGLSAIIGALIGALTGVRPFDPRDGEGLF